MDTNQEPYDEGNVPNRQVAGEGTENNSLARAAYEGRRDGTMSPEQRDVMLDVLTQRLLKRDLPIKLIQDALDAA